MELAAKEKGQLALASKIGRRMVLDESSLLTLCFGAPRQEHLVQGRQLIDGIGSTDGLIAAQLGKSIFKK